MIKLDLVPSCIKPVLHASQYDEGRQWPCEVMNDGVPFVFQNGDTVDYTIRKGDSLLVTGAVAVTPGTSTITLVSTEQMCAVYGSNLGELTITSNGTKVGSVNFILEVERAPDEGGITSQSEINNLARQVHDIVAKELEDNGAKDTGYDNTESGLEATNVQAAIDEVNTKIDNIPSVDAYTKEESDQKYATKTALEELAGDIPTKTSELQNDSGFTGIDNLTESETKTYSSAMIENKYATVFENALGDTGKFKPQNSWYATAGATGYSSANGVATFTVTAQYGGLRPANPVSQTEGHKYYTFGKVKANNKICLSYDGVGAVFSTGTGEWEFISNIYTSPNTRTRYLTISDNNASGFGEVQAKNAGVIDLTAIYGDDVPTKEVLDAKIAPMGALVSSAIGMLTNRLYKDVEALKTDVDTLNANVDTRTFKVIALGDSITAFGTGSRGWLKYFKEKINCDIIANTAVDGAWLHDKVAGTVYDGNPQAGDNNLNVLGNQVQKILNNNYDAPDLILIAVGTNSGINITAQNMYDVYWYNYQAVDIDAVDRTTDAGAYRWCLEKLHTRYPDAIIVWCSPIHGAEPAMKSANQIAAWGESLRIATQYTGQQYIESYRCGICGWKEVSGGEGEYLQDGLHPNAKGAKKLGYYNASQVKNILMQVFST